MLKGITARKLYRQRPLPHPHPLLSPLTLQCFPYVLELGVQISPLHLDLARFLSYPLIQTMTKKNHLPSSPVGNP